MNYRYAKRRKYVSRKTRSRRILVRRVTVLVLAALLLGAIIWCISYAVGLYRDVKPGEGTFEQGVTVNGTALHGYDYDGALKMLNDLYAHSLRVTVTLRWGEKTWEFTPTQVGATVNVDEQVAIAWQYGKEGDLLKRRAEIVALRESPVDLQAVLTYDETALDAYVEAIKAEIDREPVDATLEVTGSEQFIYTDEAVGYNLDTTGLEAALVEVILSGKSDPVDITPTEIAPEVTVASLKKTVTLLAEYSTSVKGSSTNRTDNVELALSNFDGLRVRPGYKISFNALVGKRTEFYGYKEAPEYDGSTVVSGTGGGTCQASTTMYGAVVHAGLQIDERHAHSMTVGYVAPSMDAAVNDTGTKDLCFTNNTSGMLYFFTSVDRKKQLATVRIYGTPLEDGLTIGVVSEVLQRGIKSSGGITYIDDTEGSRVWYTDQTVFYKEGKPGMQSRAYRVYYDASGAELWRDELSTDNYQAENDTYLRGVHARS